MFKAIVIQDNDGQYLRLPSEAEFPLGVSEVTIRRQGTDLILSPVSRAWDSFFNDSSSVSDDFLTGREEQLDTDREPLG